MSEEKNQYWDGLKKYGTPFLIFFGGVAFERYVLPRIEDEYKKKTNGKFSNEILDVVSYMKKRAADNPEYSNLVKPLDDLERYLIDKKYREENK